MNKHISQIVQQLKRTKEILIPLSIAEVEKVEKNFNVHLPDVYKSFLLVMGKGAGGYMKGSSVFYNEIYHLKEWSEELLLQNNFKPLPKNAFVFWMHQGYQFSFFYLNESDDPAVYFFSEGKNQADFVRVSDKLSDFFESQLE